MCERRGEEGMTEGVTTLVDYAGWRVRRFDCPEDDRPEWRYKYIIERRSSDSKGEYIGFGGWLSETDYQIFKIILEMADLKDLKESGVKE